MPWPFFSRRHKELAPQKYMQLEQKLRTDPRLAEYFWIALLNHCTDLLLFVNRCDLIVQTTRYSICNVLCNGVMESNQCPAFRVKMYSPHWFPLVLFIYWWLHKQWTRLIPRFPRSSHGWIEPSKSWGTWERAEVESNVLEFEMYAAKKGRDSLKYLLSYYQVLRCL